MEEPKITSKPAFSVIGMKYRGKNEHDEIPQLWGKFMAREGEIKDKLDPQICYGVEDNHDEVSGEFDYVAAFEVGKDAEVPEGMVKWDVPAQTYAAFTCTLPTIQEATETLVTESLKRADGNQSQAASLLGISRQALSKRLKRRKDEKQ